MNCGESWRLEVVDRMGAVLMIDYDGYECMPLESGLGWVGLG